MKNYKRIGILFCASLVFSLGLVHGVFNPFSKSDWEDVGNKIKGGFETVGDKLKEGFEKGIKFGDKVFHSAKDLAEEVFKKIQACTQIVPLGTEWTAKKAAYETAKAALQAADKLKVLDPRVVSLQVAEESAKLSLQIAEKNLEGVLLTAKGLSKALEGISTAVGKGFNVKEISFEAYMSKLINGKSPSVTFVAEIFGQSVKLNNFNIDFGNPLNDAKKIVKLVIDKVASPFK